MGTLRVKRRTEADVDPLEAAIAAPTPEDLARWAHWDSLPDLSDGEGALILQHPEREWTRDETARFRRWCLAQRNGEAVYSNWIAEWMRGHQNGDRWAHG